MRKDSIITLLAVGAAALLTVVSTSGLARDRDSDDEEKSVQFGISAEMRERVRDSYIFVFDDRMQQSAVAAEAERMVRAAHGRMGHVYTHAVYGFSAKMNSRAAARLVEDPRISYYEPDGVAFVSDRVEAASHTSGQSQTASWGVSRVNGPQDGTNLGKYAFVIDTGIDLDHPDLNVATSLSRSFVTGLSSPDDQNGHGTHVAGIIAAKNNSIGSLGVAAGATVVAVRVLNASGSGTFSDIIAGVDYVAQVGLPGEVANMSLGGPANTTLDNAVKNAAAQGIFFTLAAGNESQHAANVSPARAGGSNIYTISAMDSQDVFASFSNFGNPPVDCADPGVSIFSLYKNGGTATLSGTSMAAPHAAGIMLLTGGVAYNGGLVSGDPDGNPDPICVLN